MKRIASCIIIPVLFAANSYAQKNFTVSSASAKYDAKIQVQKCKEGTCSGRGTIKLYAKNNSTMLQEFKSQDLYFNLDKSNNPSSKMEMYDEESPVFFGDFNFDGNEDLAVRNGNNSGYGGPSYDVYVYNLTINKFVLSKELTRLASTNLGMFEIDKENKRIITESKSGCCWHQKTGYEVVPQKPLLKVYELVEDATKGDDNVYVTEKKFVKGKWQKSTKKYKTKEYYKE